MCSISKLGIACQTKSMLYLVVLLGVNRTSGLYSVHYDNINILGDFNKYWYFIHILIHLGKQSTVHLGNFNYCTVMCYVLN